MNSQPPQVVVFGAGPWGRNLVRVFGELEALAAVVEPDAEARQKLSDLTSAPTAATFEELPGDIRRVLTAAAVASPAATHENVGMKMLKLGLDLFVEKPLALSLAGAQRLHDQATTNDRILMVGHLLLFHPAITALKGLIDQGELGELRYIYSNRLNLGRVRKEENILWSFAPHDIAVMLHLLDEQPTNVSAQGGSWLHHDVADVTVTHCDFPSGAKAHVFVSWLHPYKEQKLVVVGSEKMAVFDDLAADKKLTLLDSGIDLPQGGIPAPRRGEHRPIPHAEDEPLRLELEHFLDCCRNRTAPLTDGPHALKVMDVLERAQDSL